MAYALYIHGMGSGSKSGTKSSLAHYLSRYEWLTPELPPDPDGAMKILEDYARVFCPEVVAGTSVGGLYTLYIDLPHATKIAINPTYNIETVLRRMGYGRKTYHCEREDGAKEWVLNEPLVKKFITLRNNWEPLASKKMIGFFSTEDELVGHEGSRANAKIYERLGYTVVWSKHFGHRLNQQAAKQLSALVD